MAEIKPNVGLTDEAQTGVVEVFSKLLADEYALYTKARKFHWNVIGPQFNTLHVLFEQQYTQIEVFVDDTAEYIRQIGAKAPGTLKEFTGLTRIKEDPGQNPSSTEMVRILTNDHEAIVRQLRQDVDKCQDDYHDAAAADFLTGLLEQHQKMAWMLRAMIAE